MSTKAIRLYDTKDDRREVYSLVHRLTPQQVIAFLRWCCARAVLPRGKQRPRVSQQTLDLADLARWDTGACERLRRETLMDFWMLVNNYDFDPDRGLARLVEIVRGK